MDALACGSLERLFTTVQLTDAGIVPGSGVGNSRRELSHATLGVPVFALGVPTVVDASSLSSGMPEQRGMIVTDRDVDALVRTSARLAARSINRVLHAGLSDDELAWMLS